MQHRVHESNEEVKERAASPAPLASRHRVERVIYVLTKGGAQLVEDLEHVEDDVPAQSGEGVTTQHRHAAPKLRRVAVSPASGAQLEHRLVAHHVIGLRHVDLEQQKRDDDNEHRAQQIALLRARQAAAAQEGEERHEHA